MSKFVPASGSHTSTSIFAAAVMRRKRPEVAQAIAAAHDPSAAIIKFGLDPARPSALCAATLDILLSILGDEAGNLALKVLATGGVYLAGGIATHVLPALKGQRFMQAFTRQGTLRRTDGADTDSRDRDPGCSRWSGQLWVGEPHTRIRVEEFAGYEWLAGAERHTRAPCLRVLGAPVISSQRSRDISDAGSEIAAIYNRNVFPDLKVTWGTYPNNLGHDDFPGCFRCHDGSHSTSDQKTTITQDCNTCHEPLAIEEAAPGVLKTIGLADRITSLQKH